MKTLIILRHGKSDWDTAESDHERPLAPRGVRAAELVGRLLRLADQVPSSVITSSAVRARTTAELAASAGEWNAPVRVTRALYEATPFAVLNEVRAEPDASESLLVAGHEPTSSELVGQLTGGGVCRFPTAAMARIDLPITSWADAGRGIGELVWFFPPKFFTKGTFPFRDD